MTDKEANHYCCDCVDGLVESVGQLEQQLTAKQRECEEMLQEIRYLCGHCSSVKPCPQHQREK